MNRKFRILDLIFQDSELKVYAGEREVRPPAAPTTGPDGTALCRR
jgi:hypothetical protein